MGANRDANGITTALLSVCTLNPIADLQKQNRCSVFHTLFGFDSGNIINKQSGTVMIRYLTRYYYSPTSILNDVTWTILNSKSNFSSFYGRKFQTLRNHSKKIGYGIS